MIDEARWAIWNPDFAVRVTTERPTIWHATETGEWWMDDADPLTAAKKVAEHLDAMHVTNAYDVLDAKFIAQLARDAHRDMP